MSSFAVTGNLTAAPELRFTASGKAVANFTVAENRKRGEDDVTHFFDCTAWDSLAENVCESLDKGVRVVVTGRVEQQSWTTDDGSKRSKLVCTTCHAGWESYASSERCGACGKTAEVRGRTTVIDLRPVAKQEAA